MAKVELLYPFIAKWEGGYVNDPLDKGGETNMGVTIATWKKVGYDKNGDGVIDAKDLKLITKDDVLNRVLKPHYWDKWKADEIRSQSVANLLVDWLWCSGSYGIRIPQYILGVEQDGIVGPKTLAALHKRDPRSFFNQVKNERKAFLYRIVNNNPTQKRFLKGWLNRLNDLKFTE